MPQAPVQSYIASNDHSLLWAPSAERIQASNMHGFMRNISRKYNLKLDTYSDLWEWSIERNTDFWSEVWDFCGVIGDKGKIILEDGDKMPGAKWFPEARLNFAENLLRRKDDQLAMAFWGEDKMRREYTYRDLYEKVAAVAKYFRAHGLVAGDRVAGFVPNMGETVICMLAAASIGAVWSSCSPDFGVEGVLDRFGQIEPKVFITANGYYFKGTDLDCLEKTREILKKLPTVERVVVIPYTQSAPNLDGLKNAILLSQIFEDYKTDQIEFARLPFNHPLYIMFSSGTTGVPKCIAHGAGGTLIQHLKEHQLHSDIKPNDRVFYFSTCGWMMWNWLVSALASNATILLFDGFPFQRRGAIIFDFIAEYKATFFGTAAKYIDAVNKLNLNPAATHDLSALRVMASTGSPLSHEGFDYVYKNIKSDVQLSSISGGTDIISCFVLGSPISPVYRGEIQAAGLGLAVEIMDDDGKQIKQQKGELVCFKPFPAMPIYFWNDPSGEKYHNAYFARFPNIWCHGDYAEQTAHNGFIIYGRSDTTLKPGGVRIGTAEIYRQVERLPDVVESLVIGQEWDNDVRVILFVKLQEGIKLNEELKKQIATQIKIHASPRHVPAKIIQVLDIPRTKSGKITELAVREVVHGRPVKNIEAMANPEALAYFKDLAELKS